MFKFTGDRVDNEGSGCGEQTKLNPGGTNSFRSGKIIDIAVTQGRCDRGGDRGGGGNSNW
jgi:hypothetical protein